MERLLFQKTIDLNHQLQELLAVGVKENLNYTLDKEGKRAVGTLNIEGDYLFNNQKQHFEDVIEIDILAPYERLNNHEDFHVEIHDYDYHIVSGNLSLDIHVNAHGVSKKEDRHILVDDEEALYEEIMDILPRQELVEAIEQVLNEKVEVLDVEGKKDDDIEIKKPKIEEEFLEDIYVNYPFYIAKNQDTYESIALQYDINVDELREMNKNQTLEQACIIRLKN